LFAIPFLRGNRFVMLNGVKHLLRDKYAEEDPSLSLRMTKTKSTTLFPAKPKRGMASEAKPG
jgi:hypothetical protein